MTKRSVRVEQSHMEHFPSLTLLLSFLFLFALASPVVFGACDCNTPKVQDASSEEVTDAGREPIGQGPDCPGLVGGEMATLDGRLPEDYTPFDLGPWTPDANATPTCKQFKKQDHISGGTIAYSHDGKLILTRSANYFNAYDAKSLRHVYGFPSLAKGGLVNDPFFATTPSLPLVALLEAQSYDLFHTQKRSMVRVRFQCHYNNRLWREDGRLPFLHRSGRYIIDGKKDKIVVRNLHTGKFFRYRTVPRAAYGMAYDPNNDRLAIHDSRRVLKVMSFQGDVLHEITHPSKQVSDPTEYVAFDPSGRYVLTSHKEGSELWDLQKETARSYNRISPTKVVFHPKGHFFVAATGRRDRFLEQLGSRKAVYLIRFSDGKILQKIVGYSHQDFALSPDGKTLAIIDRGSIYLYACQ